MRIVLVPGFTQTAQTWPAEIVSACRPGTVVPFEVPLVGFAAAVAALVETGGSAVYVGYSQGARLCLGAALVRPDLVERMVLISGTAGIRDVGERETRRRSDERLAREIERDGAGPFLARWLAQPIFATLRPDQAGARSTDPAELAASLRLQGQGVVPPMWKDLGSIRCPVLIVTGGLDRKYGQIGAELATRLTDAVHIEIDGAGHAVHLEKPELVAGAIRDFLTTSPR